MKFYVDSLDIKEEYALLLTYDKWDDYSYKTMFNASFYHFGIKISDIGDIKIAYLDDNIYNTIDKLPKVFNSLDNSFCSLWQDAKSYSKIISLQNKYNIKIFEPLNDIVTRMELLDNVNKYRVLNDSLFRFVSVFTCRNQFRRIYEGKPVLTKYHFNYSFPNDGYNYVNSELSFDVVPQSYPPTNVHAIIGSNGCGKTTLIKSIIKDLFCSDDESNGCDLYNIKEDGCVESVLLVSFNPFDDYYDFYKRITNDKFFKYIGLKFNKSNDEYTATNEVIKKRFLQSFDACFSNSSKMIEWQNFINEFSSSFYNASVLNEIFDTELIVDEFQNIKDRLERIYDSLSAGYKEVLSLITGCIDLMAEKTLLLIDEPENHLHPPLLSMLIRWLSKILISRNGFAIIATHSPIILQEIPKSCVWILERNGQVKNARRPSIETFGTNLSILTNEVFRFEVNKTGFNSILEKIVEKSNTFEEALKKFNGQLGEEAESMLRLMFFEKETKINEKNN